MVQRKGRMCDASRRGTAALTQKSSTFDPFTGTLLRDVTVRLVLLRGVLVTRVPLRAMIWSGRAL